MTEYYSLENGFTYTYKSTCRKCGQENTISVKWEDGAFEVTQEDPMTDRRITIPCTPQVTHFPARVVE